MGDVFQKQTLPLAKKKNEAARSDQVISHCRKAIILAQIGTTRRGRTVFKLHTSAENARGFCNDPGGEDLGNLLNFKTVSDLLFLGEGIIFSGVLCLI